MERWTNSKLDNNKKPTKVLIPDLNHGIFRSNDGPATT